MRNRHSFAFRFVCKVTSDLSAWRKMEKVHKSCAPYCYYLTVWRITMIEIVTFRMASGLHGNLLNASAQHGRILEQPECHLSQQITINQTITSNTQSQVTLKNIGPGFLHFTQPSEFQQLTRFLYSQVVPVSFFPHVNLFLTFPWAKVRNR